MNALWSWSLLYDNMGFWWHSPKSANSGRKCVEVILVTLVSNTMLAEIGKGLYGLTEEPFQQTSKAPTPNLQSWPCVIITKQVCLNQMIRHNKVQCYQNATLVVKGLRWWLHLFFHKNFSNFLPVKLNYSQLKMCILHHKENILTKFRQLSIYFE